MNTTVYGLKNCESCKKTMKYLADKGIEATLLDVREHAPTSSQLKRWCSKFGREAFVNKRSTTWRGLTEQQKNIESNAQAIELLQNAPTLMKRPVVLRGTNAVLGFKPGDIDKLLK